MKLKRVSRKNKSLKAHTFRSIRELIESCEYGTLLRFLAVATIHEHCHG